MDEKEREKMLENIKRMMKRELESLPQIAKDKVQLFIDRCEANQMTDEEIAECLLYLPSKYARMVCYEMTDCGQAIKLLTKIYTKDFVILCNKTKKKNVELTTPQDYLKDFKSKGLLERYVSFDELYNICNGLGINCYYLFAGRDVDNKYYKQLKTLHDERRNTKFRTGEERMIQKLLPKSLEKCLDVQAEILANKIDELLTN